jgi:hypothetical protein
MYAAVSNSAKSVAVALACQKNALTQGLTPKNQNGAAIISLCLRLKKILPKQSRMLALCKLKRSRLRLRIKANPRRD